MDAPDLNELATASRKSSTPQVLTGWNSPHISLVLTVGGVITRHRSPWIKVFIPRNPTLFEGEMRSGAIVIPALSPHGVPSLPHVSAVIYLDPRHYSLQDAARLAEYWQGFVPGQDDPAELFADGFRHPARRIERRVERALEALERGMCFGEAAGRVGLSESRLVELWGDELGAPPSTWRVFARLLHALALMRYGPLSATAAAHSAGFADSAHFSRACRGTFGLSPRQLGLEHCQWVTSL